MEIIRAKTAGFCFGVDRAVKLTYDLLAQGRKVATLGPLIHNAQVVADLEAKGAVTCPDIDAVPDGYEVIIRSHGVPRSVYDKISTRSLAYHDAARLLQKSIKSRWKRTKTVRFCLLQATPTTPKYRELSAIQAALCRFLPIWRSCKNCSPRFCNKNPSTSSRKRHFAWKVGKIAKLF